MIRERAPAKVNLVLRVGRRRADGLHELCSLFARLDLADELFVRTAGAGRDRIVCPGVPAPNLCEAALSEYRAALGADAPGPLEVEIDKRIPVAAGLGGGSADAAAVLRAANELAGRPLGPDDLRAVAARIGADVPSQVEPRHALVLGAGERIEPVSLPPLALVLVPSADGLSTAAVYREADRLGLTRSSLDVEEVRALAGRPLAVLAQALENDLEAAALSLRPGIAQPLDALRGGAALGARVTGSGPTVFGVFDGVEAAQAAAGRLPGALVAAVT